MIIEFEKPYIKVSSHKINLSMGDYILDNGSCLQFCPNEEIYRPYMKRYLGGCSYCYYRVSRKELKRLLASYNFEQETRTKLYISNGSYTYPINAGRFINEYFFIGRKVE